MVPPTRGVNVQNAKSLRYSKCRIDVTLVIVTTLKTWVNGPWSAHEEGAGVSPTCKRNKSQDVNGLLLSKIVTEGHRMLDFLDEFNRVYEANENDQAAMLQDVLSRASAACGNSDLACLHLVRGYAAYHFPKLTQGLLDVEHELNAVLSKKPDDLTARFYLACHFFDVGNFQKAYEQLKLLNYSQFRESGQIWRAIKVEELRLCCEAALEMYHSFASELSQLVDEVVSTDSENIPSPTELVRCFETSRQRLLEVLGIESYRECLSLLQRYILHAGMTEVFENRMAELCAGHGDPNM